MMVILRPGLMHVIQLKTLLLKKIQVVLVLIMDQRLKAHSQESELNAWVSLKTSQRVLLNMMVTIKPGLTHVIQLKTPLLKRTQVVLELIIRKLREPSQVLVLNAWALLRDTLTLMFSMMVTNRIGLTNATLLRILLPRKIQVELVPMKKVKMDHSQVLELSAKASLK
jgi:hypothetical protein